MGRVLNMGEVLTLNAHLHPAKVGARDLGRAMTFAEWNERACRLANALLGLGLKAGDAVAVLAYNAVEWLEIYAATAKAGLVMVPINFRLVGGEIAYIVGDSGAKAAIVQDELVDRVEGIRAGLPIAEANWIVFGRSAPPAGYHAYEAMIAAASSAEPASRARPESLWALMYTSGTTGRPKGAMRSHAGHAHLSVATLADLELGRDDTGLLVMPMCHANSLFFAGAFAYAGATCCVYDRKSFDPEHLLRVLAETRATFTSLVPTHYIMMLGLPERVRAQCNVDSVRRLLISSAPARKDTKLAVMEQFRNSKLIEMYGSTEAGWVTLLRPEEQLSRLGSIGRELMGTGRIRLLDEAGNEVADGEVGELYSLTPWSFDGYWNMPDKTAEAFRGEYLSVGDMARRDRDGYYHLVDRKKNMIISGGENIYPSEVENLLGSHPKVKDVAVIGRPDAKWGETVHAVLVLREGAAASEQEILDWCVDRIAGYKRPRSVEFIADADMPRTATGKILHRMLKERR
ncbi:MAG TPA: AMP-binding protein [Hyphomicrobiaceae bacterium]|nr:AMP-binding protein [Hyphomicrobiaceae bacterium]